MKPHRRSWISICSDLITLSAKRLELGLLLSVSKRSLPSCQPRSVLRGWCRTWGQQSCERLPANQQPTFPLLRYRNAQLTWCGTRPNIFAGSLRLLKKANWQQIARNSHLINSIVTYLVPWPFCGDYWGFLSLLLLWLSRISSKLSFLDAFPWAVMQALQVGDAVASKDGIVQATLYGFPIMDLAFKWSRVDQQYKAGTIWSIFLYWTARATSYSYVHASKSSLSVQSQQIYQWSCMRRRQHSNSKAWPWKAKESG